MTKLPNPDFAQTAGAAAVSKESVLPIAAIAFALFTAQPPAPPRDRPPPQPIGTARVKGRVVDAQSGTALPRARVRIMGPGGNRPLALTDETGAFEFAELPAGNFSLSVDRAGYLTSRHPEQAQTLRGNRPLTVADGQTLTGVVVPMYRGGAITGRVLDAHGDPVDSSQIQVLRLPAGGSGMPQQRGNASTNDLGEFRAARLDPGTYLVVAIQRNQQPDDPSDAGSVATFYPGVASLDQAQPLKIERGQTVNGIDFMLVDASLSAVSGTVVDATGKPASAGSVQVRRVTAEFRDFGSFGGPIRPDGTFKLKLAPGDYEIEAHAMPPGSIGGGPMLDQLMGVADVSVSSAPVSDITIRLGGGASISGRIVFEGNSAPPTDVGDLRLYLGSTRDFMCRPGRSEIAADWTFHIDGASGTCTWPQMGVGRWTIRRVAYNDADLLEQPFTLRPGSRMRDVKIVFSDRRNELTLQVADEHDVATREYVALVFSHDRTRWTDQSRFVRAYVPQPAPAAPAAGRATPGTATTGSTTVAAPRPARPDMMVGLPPGDYYVVALDDLAVEGWRDPAVLETFVPVARSITIGEDEKTTISLKRRAAR
jgi:hypothetical protein